VIAILAGLLASADPIFKQNFAALFKLFDVDRLAEYIFRGFYILILAYLLAGAYLHAFFSSSDERLIGMEKPWLPKFLGWIEAVILLISIDLLYGFFVGIQFKYFFGGQSNIVIDGFTYAEYARKGFFELLTVAVITLTILQVLNSLTKQQSQNQVRIFTGLSIGMVVLVLVILVSAFQRLSMYEAGYGVTRLRTYSHIFIVWLGLLLAAAVILELVRRTRLFALCLLLAVFGFGITLNMLNVDGFIARQNIQKGANVSSETENALLNAHTRSSESEVDIHYLVTLSDDAIPEIASQYLNSGLNAEQHALIGATLACMNYYAINSTGNSPTPWMSFHFSRSRAHQVLKGLSGDLAAYPIKVIGDYMPSTEINGQTIYCQGQNTND